MKNQMNNLRSKVINDIVNVFNDYPELCLEIIFITIE